MTEDDEAEVIVNGQVIWRTGDPKLTDAQIDRLVAMPTEQLADELRRFNAICKHLIDVINMEAEGTKH